MLAATVPTNSVGGVSLKSALFALVIRPPRMSTVLLTSGELVRHLNPSLFLYSALVLYPWPNSARRPTHCPRSPEASFGMLSTLG